MSLNIYLFFDGECADAFDYYRSVFGGEFAARMKYSEGPLDFTYKEASKDRVMHMSLPVGESVLMGSDMESGSDNPPKPSNNFAVSYSAKSAGDADRVFAALSDGGVVTMPMQNTFWGSYFGSCRDKFGVNWMVSADPKS